MLGEEIGRYMPSVFHIRNLRDEKAGNEGGILLIKKEEIMSVLGRDERLSYREGR